MMLRNMSVLKLYLVLFYCDAVSTQTALDNTMSTMYFDFFEGRFNVFHPNNCMLCLNRIFKLFQSNTVVKNYGETLNCCKQMNHSSTMNVGTTL